MFDVGSFEILLVIVVSLIVIKPEDLPKVMRSIGRGIRKINKLGREFYAVLDDMAYEIDEKEELKKKQEKQEKKVDE